MLDRAKALLLAVDFQVKLLPLTWDAEGVVARTVRLIRGAHLLGLPILATEQYPQGLGATDPRLIEALGADYRPLVKATMSCMGDASFREALAATGRRQVILCGIEAHVCVHQTAVDLAAAGYDVHLAADCVSSRRERDVELALRRSAQIGCKISTHEMAVFEMLGVSGTPDFKEWIRIVR
jgi:nicotinamidase-related amidase